MDSSKRRVHGLWAIAIAVYLTNGERLSPQAANDSPSRGRTYALLVGVTDYPNLPTSMWLKGPANDVALMIDVLKRAPFSVAASDITRLAGWPAEPASRPTHFNIERAFKRLEQTVTSNDRVVVFMAGHGSQQPADDDPDDDEPDGMDEIFLPADAGKWDGRVGAVQNAIVDDDIRRWLTAIRNKGAFVWLLFDSCQSGTMARGTNAERDRRVTPDELSVPAAAFRKTRGSSGTTDTQLFGLSDKAGGIVAMYAAQPRETTPEKRLPNAGSPWHGLFTYTLARVIEDSRSPLTYRELAERVIARYRAEGRPVPNPMFEGGAVDRTLLDQRIWPDRPDILLESDGGTGEWTLRAGAIQGLTRDSILEVFPPAGTADADTAIGYVKVLSIEATSAKAEATAFNGRAPNLHALVAGGRARLVTIALGVDRIRIGLQRTRGSQGGAAAYEMVVPGRGPAHLEDALASVSGDGGVAQRVSNEDDAEWVLRETAGDVVLVPAYAWGEASVTAPLPVAYRVATSSDPMLGTVLRDHLKRIVRARNLLRLAASSSDSQGDVDVQVELTRSSDGSPIPMPPGGRTLRAGERVAFVIRNTGRVPIDVTLLNVTDGLGIVPLAREGESVTVARLEVGQRQITPSWDVMASRVELDQVVTIAVASSPVPVNFAALAQPSLEEMQNSARTRSAAPRVSGSALQDLLAEAMYSGSATRSLGSAQVKEYAMRLIAWRSLPAGR